MGGQGSGPKRDPARDAEMSDLRRQGLTLAEIGVRFGVSRQAVKVAMDRLGVPSPDPLRAAGFRAFSPERRREVAVRGGKAAAASPKRHHFTAAERQRGARRGGRATKAKGTGHHWTSDEAKVAGRKGRLAQWAKKRGECAKE